MGSSCGYMVAVSSNIQSLKLIAHSFDKSGFGGGGERVNNVTRRRWRSLATFRADKSFASSSSSSWNVWGRSDLLKAGKILTPSIDTCCRSHLIADFAPATSAVYGSLLLGGGLFAYSKSGSKGSLLGGLSGATLMCAAYFLMQASETKEIGDAITFGSALLFASVFGIRLAATRKLIPSGLLLGISIGVTAVSLVAYLQDKTLM